MADGSQNAAVDSDLNAPDILSELDAPDGDRSETRTDEPWLSRFRLVLWSIHQPVIAWLLLACLFGMTAYFLVHAQSNQGLIDIDRAQPLIAEFKVDINSAELGEIVVLPGVGEKLAQAIIDHRASAGPFQSLHGLKDVPGIGEKKLENLMPYLLPLKPSK